MEENIQALKARRNFLIKLKNRAKFQNVNEVLHKSDELNKPDASDFMIMRPLKSCANRQLKPNSILKTIEEPTICPLIGREIRKTDYHIPKNEKVNKNSDLSKLNSNKTVENDSYLCDKVLLPSDPVILDDLDIAGDSQQELKPDTRFQKIQEPTIRPLIHLEMKISNNCVPEIKKPDENNCKTELNVYNTDKNVDVKEKNLLFLKCHEVLLPSDNEIETTLKLNSNNEIDPFADSDDSKDLDYLPEGDENPDDCEINISRKRSKKFVILENILLKPKSNVKKHLKNIKLCNENKTDHEVQHCEYHFCNSEVFSTCSHCFCFLCWEHFFDENSYNNCMKHVSKSKNKTDIKFLNKAKEQIKIHQNTFKHKIVTQHCENIGCTKSIFSTCTTCSCFLCIDHFMCPGSDNCNDHKPFTSDAIGDGPILTKDGTLRKRKLYNETLDSREKKKAMFLLQTKFGLKRPCELSCKKQCTSKFDENTRESIHKEYHNLNWESQGIFIKGLVDIKPVARRNQNIEPKRQFSHAYFLITNDNEKVEVCKTFFLSTLGYDPKNDRRVLSAVHKPVDKQKSLKGSYKRKQTVDHDIIKKHIYKYEPSISHYRREHAPNRLYLPSDLNVALMYKDFCDTHPNVKLSCEAYRKILRHDLNISFSNLGHEECEECAYFQLHDKNHVEKQRNDCEICSKYEKHRSNYTQCRREYQKDVQKSTNTSNSDTSFYSVDLQKVVMLPRIDQYKAAIFCSRIIAYNETFVPLGSTSKSNVPFAVVWPETLSGRNQEDIISTYRSFLIHQRDTKHIVLWMDNCSAQNKNWALFSFLVDIINSDLIAAETICFKYFEPGHTFMSADSFHHQVELSLKRMKKVYDFDDFVEAVKQSNSKKNFVKVMQLEDFYEYSDLSSQVRLRKREPRCYLKNIMCVKAERGHYELRFKLGHEEADEESLDFLGSKILKAGKFPIVKAKTSPRGITKHKKDEILKKLVPLMPENRRSFWLNLTVTD